MANMKDLVINKSVPTQRSSMLDAYFREVNKYDLVSPNEEVELINAYQAGDEAAGEKIILANLRFVISVAKQHMNGSVQLHDLISAGNIGLIRALQRFDTTRGFKFISYAVWWIRQAMLSEIANNGAMIRVPLNVINTNNKYKKEHDGDDMPHIAALKVSSMSAKVGPNNDIEIGDLLMSDAFKSPDDFNVGMPDIYRFVSRLKRQEQLVIKMKYGLDGYRDHSFTEIAMLLGDDDNPLSTERIRQIHSSAIRRLKVLTSNRVMNSLN